jgi:hypothetical protein
MSSTRRGGAQAGGSRASIAAFESLDARPWAAQAAGNVFAGTTQGTGGALFWRMGGSVLVLAVLLLGPLAARADAQPRIKVSCKIYDTNRVDPIAHTLHLHHHFGNTSTTNRSTGKRLFNRSTTSCDKRWFTSAGWFPVERGEGVRGVQVYYRAPGNQKTIKAIPKGLQLLATEQKYSCGEAASFSATPPYRCKDTWGTSVAFPDCINTSRLANEATNAVNSRNGVCPRTHPYRIPKISFLVTHYD